LSAQTTLTTQPTKTRLGSVLLDMGLITHEELADLLERQRTDGGRLGELLVAHERLTPEQVAKALARRLGLEYVTLATAPSTALTKLLPEVAARRCLALPIRRDPDGVLVVAMADPQDLPTVDDLTMILGEPIRRALAMPEAIMSYVGIDDGVEQLAASMGALSTDVEAPPGTAELAVGENDGPVIRFVNSVIARAVAERASDIHLEPQEGELVVRFRIDGVLRAGTSVPAARAAAIVSRIKVMSELDIAERRLPQDGRFSLTVGERTVDLRVATLPTVGGESVVVRLLDRDSVALDLSELGFSAETLRNWEGCYRHPHGLILVTGPTGSGKTSTLYATLQRLNDNARKIITVEDPVEFRVPGINQVQVHPKAGLTFASGLRSMLRCDPDVIMVGEIRDAETAQIAVEAALTGHMVLATLHTNDAAGAIVRLTEMGIEPFMLGSALRGVLAQRLTRRLCHHCRATITVPRGVLARECAGDPAELVTVHHGNGCRHCSGTGYRGRFALGETLVMSRTLEDLVTRRAPSGEIRSSAHAAGMTSMLDDGLTAVLRGDTSIEELQRVMR
jgi:type IV pilus assembly protein PilB